MERVAHHGEGWLGLLVSPDGVARRRHWLAGRARELARRAPRVGVVLFVNVNRHDPDAARLEAQTFLRDQFGLSAEQSRRHMVAGTEAHVLAALRAFVGAGVDQFVLFPAAPDYPAQYERFARCADRLRASRDLIGSGL
jgi:alkanesulfonate monooxygenase SsuD/methylene tetrahydromethanopterin reductase-like flavin-dependent oxidoreductase (luciferase family)